MKHIFMPRTRMSKRRCDESHDNHVRDPSGQDTTSSSTTSSDDERIIYFAGDVTETSVSQAIAELFTFAKNDSISPVYMIIETYGGSVDSMFSLYDAMKFVTCPIVTIALGKVMSAGVLILAAGDKGKRMIAPHARVMTHPAWGIMAGNIFEIKHELKEMERQEQQWISAMANETGLSQTKLIELNSRQYDQYLTPEECIELGICDSLLYDINDVMKRKGKGKRRKTKRSKK